MCVFAKTISYCKSTNPPGPHRAGYYAELIMNRNDRKIEAWAKKQGLKVEDVPNKLHQIKRKAVRRRRPKTNPNGRTILVKDNEVLTPPEPVKKE